MKRFALLLSIAALALISLRPAFSNVKPNAMFADGAVLQRDMPVPVWGTADDGEKVTVEFAGQTESTVAKEGKWMVRLRPLKAGGPFEMTISGVNKITLKNMLVGDVWICAGQSNMEFALKRCVNAPEVMAKAADPKIRFMEVTNRGSETPLSEIEMVNGWQECNPETAGEFSAVGYFFGRDIRKALDVPIGLIDTALGGSGAEAWMKKSVLESDPASSECFRTTPTWVKAYRAPYKLYNAMIAPMQPYAIKGVIWYQGESNVKRAYDYRKVFPMLIENWRKDWGQGDFPFLFVQLPGFHKKPIGPEESTWAELREAQLLTSQKCPRTGMAVMCDTGDENNIHPTVKEPAGVRLALVARALVYGEKIVYQGPVYKSVRIDGGTAVIAFDSVGGDLIAKEGDLKGFTICGEDRKWVNAKAEIKGDTVIVSSPDVPKPVAVRYGWSNFPIGNLYNKEQLPASPFRTDDFSLTTGPK